jgi:O-antigen/teichoic acid export membrane protein
VDYSAAAPVLAVLGIAASIEILTGPIQTAVSATPRIAKFVPWFALQAGVTLITAAILIPNLGALGAALGLLFGALIGALIRYRFYVSTFHLGKIPSKPLIRIVGTLIALLAVLNAFSSTELSDLTIAGISCGLYGVVVFGMLSRKEKSALRRLIRKIAGVDANRTQR